MVIYLKCVQLGSVQEKYVLEIYLQLSKHFDKYSFTLILPP
jgi:hypothetical protein